MDQRKQDGTHRHTHNRVSVGWAGPVSGFGRVVVHEERHHMRHCRERDICNAVHLLNVHYRLVHLAGIGEHSLHKHVETVTSLINNGDKEIWLHSFTETFLLLLWFNFSPLSRLTGSEEI